MTGWCIDHSIHQIYPGGYAVCLHCTCRNSFHKYLSWGSCSWRASVTQQPFSISLFDRVDVALRWYGLLMLIFCRWMRKSGCSSCVIYIQQQLQLQLGVALPSERVLAWHRTRPVLHGRGRNAASGNLTCALKIRLSKGRWKEKWRVLSQPPGSSPGFIGYVTDLSWKAPWRPPPPH